METARLTKYRNDHVPGLKSAPNMDDHSTYLAEVKRESWSYPAKGNVLTIRQFVEELRGCPDSEAGVCPGSLRKISREESGK